MTIRTLAAVTTALASDLRGSARATLSLKRTAGRLELAQALEEPSRRRERLCAHVLAVRERDLD